jgi:hypothetical protein
MKKIVITIAVWLTIIQIHVNPLYAQTVTPIPTFCGNNCPTPVPPTPIPDQRGNCCGPNALCAQGACSIDMATGQGVCTTTCVPISGANPDFSIPNYNTVGGGTSLFNFNGQNGLTAIGSIISEAMPYVIVIVGLLLFFYLLYGAFTWLSSMGNPSGISAGSTIMTRALIGFTIIFASYWIVQIIEIIWGLDLI